MRHLRIDNCRGAKLEYILLNETVRALLQNIGTIWIAIAWCIGIRFDSAFVA